MLVMVEGEQHREDQQEDARIT